MDKFRGRKGAECRRWKRISATGTTRVSRR